MKTRMNVRSEIVTRVSQGNSIRRSVAVLIFLVLFLHGIQLNPYAVFGQQGNIDPRVASQEAVDRKTQESSVLIPIIPLSTLPVFRLLRGGASGAASGAAIPCGCREAVTQLTLEYEGATALPVTVFDSNKRELFSGTVASGQQFSFTGHQNQKMRAVTLRVNDRFHTTIKTSCSQQVGPGLIRGDFVVISGKSSGETSLCPVKRRAGEAQSRKILKAPTIEPADQK